MWRMTRICHSSTLSLSLSPVFSATSRPTWDAPRSLHRNTCSWGEAALILHNKVLTLPFRSWPLSRYHRRPTLQEYTLRSRCLDLSSLRPLRLAFTPDVLIFDTLWPRIPCGIQNSLSFTSLPSTPLPHPSLLGSWFCCQKREPGV